MTHQAPHWSASAGRVLVEEVITLHGLEVQRRKVAYGNINPKDATAIFIRSALVEDNLEPKIVQRRLRPLSSPLAAGDRRQRVCSSTFRLGRRE